MTAEWFRYEGIDAFQLALAEQEAATDWYSEVPVNDFQFDNHGNELTLNFGRGITVEVPTAKFDNRALEGVLERLQVEGKGFKKLRAEILAPTLNNFSAVANGDAEIAVREGKVLACLSSGSTQNDFCHLLSSDVLDKTIMSVHMNWGEEEAFIGVLEEKHMQASFKLPKEKLIGGSTFKVSLKFNTSDYGRSAIHYRADLESALGEKIPVFEQEIVHRSGNTMDRIDETLSMLEKSVEDGAIRLEAMKSIMIENPCGAMRRIGRKFKLPKRDVLPVIAEYERHGNAACSAYGCYKMLCKGIIRYEERSSLVYSQQYISKVMSLIGCDWKEYDLPGAFNW